MIVIDASALVDGLIDERPERRLQVWSRVWGKERVVTPEIIDLEVVSAVRRKLFAGEIDTRRAETALAELAEAPLRRSPHKPLLSLIWEMRNNVSAYDGAYVALAQALEVPLLTADARLSRAADGVCEVELLSD